MELDEDSLVAIFSAIGDARTHARLALVCKRWRDVRRLVTRLSFSFGICGKKDLRKKEQIIRNVLAQNTAILKYLKVEFCTLSTAVEVSGDWLSGKSSLTELHLFGSLRWGPGVWYAIANMKSVQDLTLLGCFPIIKILPLPQGLQLTRLHHFSLSRCYNMFTTLLETIISENPVLESLSLDCCILQGSRLQVTSRSLTTFKFLGVWATDYYFLVALDAPNLTSFQFGNKLNFKAALRIQFQSKSSLQKLDLISPCVILNANLPHDTLKKLMISGKKWKIETDLTVVLERLPMITELHLDLRPIVVSVDNVLPPLVNLRHIHFYGETTTYFKTGNKRMAGLHVHVHMSTTFRLSRNYYVLRAFLDHHKIAKLLVHYKNVVNMKTRSIMEPYTKSWEVLLNLMIFYPERVLLDPK